MIVPLWFVLALPFVESAAEGCVLEYSQALNGSRAAWEYNNRTLVISNPPCLDEDGLFYTRTCLGDRWRPTVPPQCHQLADSECASGLFAVNATCALVTEPQPFSKACPENSIKYYRYSNFRDGDKDFWLPIKRENNVLQFISKNQNYGREFYQENFTNDCFAQILSTMKGCDCNESHRHICMYVRDGSTANARRTPELDLHFDQKRKEMILIVYFQNNLQKMYDTDLYAIYCFTNAASATLKTRVESEEIFNKPNKMLVIKLKLLDYPGQYWCQASDLNDNVITTRKVVGYKKDYGNEYALRVILKDFCESCKRIKGKNVLEFLEKHNLKHVFQALTFVVRYMAYYEHKSEQDVEVLLHITTKRKINVVGEFYKLLRLMRERMPANIVVVNFSSSEYCMAEHKVNNTWALTMLGQKIVSGELCLDENNKLLTRRCIGDFLEGAFWSKVSDVCYVNVNQDSKTLTLYEILMGNITENETAIIREITEGSDLSALDVYLVAYSLYNISKNRNHEKEVDNVVDTINNIVQYTDSKHLKLSQGMSNSTDVLLDTLDHFLKDVKYLISTQDKPFILQKEQILIHYTKPFISNISGLAIYCKALNKTFSEARIVNLNVNQTFDDIDHEDLEIATYVSLDLLNTLVRTEEEKNNLSIITTIFYDDKLFNNYKEVDVAAYGRIVSVTIPNYGVYLKQPIPLLFRTKENNTNHLECAFWNYGDQCPNKSGEWSTKGSDLEKHGNFFKCYFYHLTHFALLIVNQKLFVNEPNMNATETTDSYNTNGHELFLTVITRIGCALSLMGILGIFATAMCFRRWRAKTGTKILLQLSITISLEIPLVHIADSPIFDLDKVCNLIGILLHYIVLSKFCWMFVSAILQYIRFVKVFTVLPPRLVLKTMLFCWLFPLIPVVLVLIFLPDTYIRGAQRFCYPSDFGLYLGLFLPIVLIVFGNLVVFFLVMKNVFQNRIDTAGRPKDVPKLQIYLGILLFFMLGIPWVFGILAEWLSPSVLQIVFVYLFCLTATLQGCVIFIFYVILDNNTRHLWVAFLKRRMMIFYK